MATKDLVTKPKWRAHETFFIRKGWLSKGMFAVKDKGDLFVDKSINQMDVLGIGSNMVKSLRYWLQATGVTIEEADPGRRGKRIQKLTPLGELVLNNDPYLEEIGTLWVLHYELVNKKAFVPAWYFFFNEMKMRSFSQEDFIRLIEPYSVNVLGADKPPAVRLSSDDFNCILGTYISKGRMQTSRVSPESNIDCPFGELGLIQVENLRDKTYRKKQTDSESLPAYALLYALIRYRDDHKASSESEEFNILNLEELLNYPGSPGKAFNLDSFSLVELLRMLENRKLLHVVRTAGLDEIRLTTDMQPIDCLKQYYREVG